MNLLHTILLYGFAVVIGSDKYTEFQKGNKVVKNEMHVEWEYTNKEIEFTMAAPTSGWVTIGFNSKQGMAGCYLLMGRVVNGKVEVVEHYTQSPGKYAPISTYDVRPQVKVISGIEEDGETTIQFKLPQKAISKYQKDLTKNSEYYMVLAYSNHDDFQHHSAMRTSVKIKL